MPILFKKEEREKRRLTDVGVALMKRLLTNIAIQSDLLAKFQFAEKMKSIHVLCPYWSTA